MSCMPRPRPPKQSSQKPPFRGQRGNLMPSPWAKTPSDLIWLLQLVSLSIFKVCLLYSNSTQFSLLILLAGESRESLNSNWMKGDSFMVCNLANWWWEVTDRGKQHHRAAAKRKKNLTLALKCKHLIWTQGLLCTFNFHKPFMLLSVE